MTESVVDIRSTIVETITTSSAVISTSAPVISTVTTSYCVAFASLDNNQKSVESTDSIGRPTQTQVEVNRPNQQETSQDENANQRWTGKWGHRDRTPATTFPAPISDGTWGVNALLKADPTDSSEVPLPHAPSPTTTRSPFSSALSHSVHHSYDSHSPPSSSATLSHTPGLSGAKKPETTEKVGTPPQFAGVSGSGVTRTKGPRIHPAFPDRGDRHRRQNGQCLQWTTKISTSTFHAPAETVWQTSLASSIRYEAVNVPVETIFESCAVESSSERVIAALVTSSEVKSAVTGKYLEGVICIAHRSSVFSGPIVACSRKCRDSARVSKRPIANFIIRV